MLRQSKQGSSHQKKVQFNQSAKKVVTNDSIGTFSPGLYILYLLKLPAPPRADLSGTLWFINGTNSESLLGFLKTGTKWSWMVAAVAKPELTHYAKTSDVPVPRRWLQNSKHMQGTWSFWTICKRIAKHTLYLLPSMSCCDIIDFLNWFVFCLFVLNFRILTRQKSLPTFPTMGEGWLATEVWQKQHDSWGAKPWRRWRDFYITVVGDLGWRWWWRWDRIYPGNEHISHRGKRKIIFFQVPWEGIC